MDRLVSKIIAGGLSAGVFLFWWPDHIVSESLATLAIRGLLWTLTFELLLLAVGPAERLFTAHLDARVSARRDRVKTRLSGVPAPARTSGVVALACCGIAAPLALLADAPSELVNDDKPRVVKQVIVERPVVEKKIIVRKVVAPAAADAAATARLQSIGASPSGRTPQVARTAARASTTQAGPVEKTGTKAADTATSSAPSTTKAATTPAAPSTAKSDIGTPAAGTSSDAPAAASTPPAP
jgi:hypothetical protein